MNLVKEKSKRYLKLIGINFKYILSKQSVFFLSISFIILFVSFIFNTNFLSNTSSKILYEKEYYNSYVTGSYNVLIAIFGLLSVFLSIMFSNSYDLYLISRCKRIEIIISKIICGALFELFYIYISFSIFNIIPVIFLRYYKFKASFISDFLLIYLNGLFLLLISMLMIEIFKNVLSCFMVLVIFWAMKIFTNSSIKKNTLIYYINDIFPTLIVDEIKTKVYFPNIYIVFPLILLLIFLLSFYYVKKDFK